MVGAPGKAVCLQWGGGAAAGLLVLAHELAGNGEAHGRRLCRPHSNLEMRAHSRCAWRGGLAVFHSLQFEARPPRCPFAAMTTARSIVSTCNRFVRVPHRTRGVRLPPGQRGRRFGPRPVPAVGGVDLLDGRGCRGGREGRRGDQPGGGDQQRDQRHHDPHSAGDPPHDTLASLLPIRRSGDRHSSNEPTLGAARWAGSSGRYSHRLM